jgi:hypothetical protein
MPDRLLPLRRDMDEHARVLADALLVVRRLPAIIGFIERAPDDRRAWLLTRLNLDLHPLLYALHQLGALPGRRYVPELLPEQYAELRDAYLTPLACALAAQWRVTLTVGEPLRALAAERGQHRDEAKLDTMRQAVLVVLADRAVPTSIDVRPWLGVRPDGAAVPVDDVHVLDFLRWWRRRVYRTAEAILTDAGSPGTTAEPEVELGADPVAVLAEPDDRVDAIYAAARDDMDQRLLAGLADGLSIADASREAGIEPAAGRQRITRLRKRANPG